MDIYMELPQGIQTKHGNSKEHVLKLEKNIYGQKQAGRMWNLFLVDKLTSIGFTMSLIDDCIFFRSDIIFMVHVDDGIFLGSNDLQLQEVIKEIQDLCLNIEDQGHPADLEAAIWIRQVQVYNSLLRYHKGKIKNRGNLKRAARQCNIPNPLQLSIQEITHRLEVCKKECIFYQEHGKCFRRNHLKNQKKIAQEQEDEEAFNKISAIIQQEHKRDFWQS